MAGAHPDYTIYAEELACRRHGYALWNPDSRDRLDGWNRTSVQIGDVGYCHSGGFYRMFNIHLDADDPDQAPDLPEYFEPLQLRRNMIQPTRLHPGGYPSRTVRAVQLSASGQPVGLGRCVVSGVQS